MLDSGAKARTLTSNLEARVPEVAKRSTSARERTSSTAEAAALKRPDDENNATAIAKASYLSLGGRSTTQYAHS